MARESRKKRFSFSAQKFAPGAAAEKDVLHLQALLGRYGFLRSPCVPGKYDDATRDAVTQFQSYYRIDAAPDGVCDEATVKLLHQPRCGMRDMPFTSHRTTGGRLAPFVAVGSRWPEPNLNYRILNATPDLTPDRQRAILREAFDRWSAVSALRFTEVPANQPSQLSVAFHRGSHGDTDAFDDAGGPDGNTLAHAYFPPPNGGSFAGSLHFDEFELWKDQAGGEGIRLYSVALHEIGHLLGLDHSQDSAAIMFAYYGEERNDLRADDVAGIQSLYGGPAAGPAAMTPGERINGHLAGTNAEVRYQVTVQSKLLIRLDGPVGSDFDVYVRRGAPPGREAGQFDAAAYGVTADELVTVDKPQAGTYHVLVHSYRGSGSYTLEAEVT